MSYVVTSEHVETLKSGRSVAPRDEVSDKEARQNPRLIKRGALTERADSKPAPKPKATVPEKPEPEKEENQ